MRKVLIIPNSDGSFTATVPSLRGCISQGDTFDEALTNIKDAIDLFIEDMIASGEEVPDEVPVLKMDLHPGAITISDDFNDELPDSFWFGEA
jgi:antitoxin HicB